VIVVSDFKLATHKTKDFVQTLRRFASVDATTLVVMDVVDQNLRIASRNVVGVQVEPADSVNTYELLQFAKIVTTQAGLSKLQERLSK